jgi:hypothetical protein
MMAMAIRLEIEADDLHVLLDRFSTLGLGVTLVQASLCRSQKVVVCGIAKLRSIQSQIGTQRDMPIASEGLQECKIAIWNQQNLRCSAKYVCWNLDIARASVIVEYSTRVKAMSNQRQSLALRMHRTGGKNLSEHAPTALFPDAVD